MSTKEIISCVLLTLPLFSISSAQPAKFDVFPLKTHLHYRYRYQYSQSYWHLGVLQDAKTDTGSVECIVHDAVASGDTTLLWNIEVRFSLFHREKYFYLGLDTTWWQDDTVSYTLRENTSSQHELIADNIVWIFPVWTPLTRRPVYRFSDSASVVISEPWSNGCDVSLDSLWFSDTAGLYRRASEKHYRGCECGGCAFTDIYKTITLVGTPTLFVREPEHLPVKAMLQQNYPNPFNRSTTIRYGLPHKSSVDLTIYNTLGQQVTILVQGDQEAGYHEIKFDGSSVSSGVYFYRLRAGDFVRTNKLLLIR
jgi:hypothetical protein